MPAKKNYPDGINVRTTVADRNYDLLYDGLATLREAVYGSNSDSPLSTLVRDLLAELFIPGQGNRILRHLDLNRLDLPRPAPTEPPLLRELESIHQELDELRTLVKLSRDDTYALAISALVQYGDMDPDAAVLCVRDAMNLD